MNTERGTSAPIFNTGVFVRVGVVLCTEQTMTISDSFMMTIIGRGRLYPKGGIASRTAAVRGFKENLELLHGRCFSTMVDG
jgi:hypothetical protein